MRLPMLQPSNTNGMQACPALRARLSVTSCAKRWRLAQDEMREQMSMCAECATGRENQEAACE